MTRSMPTIDVVAPMFNEAANVALVVEAVMEVFDDLDRSSEHRLIVVDDGSSDATLELLRDASNVHSRLSVLSFSRNFGHQAAVTAGLMASRGDVVIVIDGDLQDDPGAIKRFVDEYRAGYDVVYGIRTRRTETLPMRIGYWLHYRIAQRIARPAIPPDAGDFSLMSRRVVNVLNSLPERQRYVRGLRAWAGFTQKGIAVERLERPHGRTSYSFGRRLNLAFDGLFSFSVVPIRLALLIGVLVLAVGVAFSVYTLYIRLTRGISPAGFTALLLVTTMLSGTVLAFLGIIGEYVGRIYEEVKHRPQYVLAEQFGSDLGDG